MVQAEVAKELRELSRLAKEVRDRLDALLPHKGDPDLIRPLARIAARSGSVYSPPVAYEFLNALICPPDLQGYVVEPGYREVQKRLNAYGWTISIDGEEVAFCWFPAMAAPGSSAALWRKGMKIRGVSENALTSKAPRGYIWQKFQSRYLTFKSAPDFVRAIADQIFIRQQLMNVDEAGMYWVRQIEEQREALGLTREF